MSKTIRVSDQTYQALEGILAPRETFNEVILRILKVYQQMRTVSDSLGAGHYLKREKP